MVELDEGFDEVELAGFLLVEGDPVLEMEGEALEALEGGALELEDNASMVVVFAAAVVVVTQLTSSLPSSQSFSLSHTHSSGMHVWLVSRFGEEHRNENSGWHA